MKTISSLKTKMAAFTTDESGATIIEYALLAGLIVVALVGVLNTLQGKLGGSFGNASAVL